MRYTLLCLCFLYWIPACSGQEFNCESGFTQDTVSIPGITKVMDSEMMKVTLKNQSVVELHTMNRNKYFIRLYTTENFYFNKVDVLHVESGKWSIPIKNCKQHKITKTLGMYVFEVQKNYLVTLRDEGMTGWIFLGAETDFTKSDDQQVKKMCKCFYETIFGKK